MIWALCKHFSFLSSTHIYIVKKPWVSSLLVTHTVGPCTSCNSRLMFDAIVYSKSSNIAIAHSDEPLRNIATQTTPMRKWTPEQHIWAVFISLVTLATRTICEVHNREPMTWRYCNRAKVGNIGEATALDHCDTSHSTLQYKPKWYWVTGCLYRFRDMVGSRYLQTRGTFVF